MKYLVDIYDSHEEWIGYFELEADNDELASDIVNNIVCSVTQNEEHPSDDDLNIFTDDPEDGKILLHTIKQFADTVDREENIKFMDGLTFEIDFRKRGEI